MDALMAIKERISIRSYKPEPVREEDIAAIISAAQQSPFAGGLHFSVITNKEIIEKMSETGRQMMLSGNDFARGRASLEGYTPLYHAPALIIISGKENGGGITSSLSAENIMIAATSLGYGSCYIASITPLFNGDSKAEYASLVGMPEGYSFNCGVVLGITDDPTAYSLNPRPERSYPNVNYVK